ncbi:MAG TPA: sigma-70 family RNA polymerase sigma factor, partial [Solirubrobacteraceae bacterium]|nr:sigma-70 family RNA polymerase sigma factor [Solirubrobacteraceae bacterium]
DEISRLYPEVAPQLRRVLGSHLRAPDWVLDDACQVAWEALIVRRESIDRSRLLSWLATTARREALAIMRRAGTDLAVEDGALDGLAADRGDPQQAAEFWERMGRIRRLSRRQQRIVWMHGMGFAYEEIAGATGESLRAVERQLSGARRRLRAA